MNVVAVTRDTALVAPCILTCSPSHDIVKVLSVQQHGSIGASIGMATARQEGYCILLRINYCTYVARLYTVLAHADKVIQ
jgi:hypothetical protein